MIVQAIPMTHTLLRRRRAVQALGLGVALSALILALLWACGPVTAARSAIPQLGPAETVREQEGEVVTPSLLSIADDLEALRSMAEASLQEGGKPVGAYLTKQSKLALASGHLGLTVGFVGGETGTLTLWDLKSGEQLLAGIPSLAGVFREGPSLPYEPRNFRYQRINEDALGAGLQLEAMLATGDGIPLTQLVTVYSDQRWTYQLMGAGEGPTVFRYFDGAHGGHVLGGANVKKLVDPDAFLPSDQIGLGRPLIVWGDEMPGALVFAVVDETETSAFFSLEPIAETPAVAFTLEQVRFAPALVDGRVASPRLLVDFVRTQDPAAATMGYRELMARLYPPVAMPDWVRYQWLSWYVSYIDVDEALMRRHVDYIAGQLGDLGPWHLLLDAGWYITEGRPGSDWRAVDYEKFPSGIRALVDYAHQKGAKVVLYFSLPYLDDNEAKGNWNGLSGLIDQAPEWLIPVGDDGMVRSFLYDLDHPGFQSYLREVMQDFFERYDVDGIKVDGLGNAGKPTLAYRLVYENAVAFKQGVYVEGAWQNPVYAHPYSHTFRYGDESFAFDAPYPNGGLQQHIDYALYQNFILGQRSNMGAITGSPADPLGLRWLEASLALGSQVSLSFDLSSMSPDRLSDYRARLMHYEPFVGTRRFSGPATAPSAFSYQVGDFTYLGVINRGEEPASVAVSLAEHGISAGQQVTVYDATSRSYSRKTGSFSVALQPKEFRLLVLKQVIGPFWTNSSVTVELPGESSLILHVQGPAETTGFLDMLTPMPLAVEVDGERRDLQEELRDDGYYYDPSTRVLRLRYDHMSPHHIVVRW